MTWLPEEETPEIAKAKAPRASLHQSKEEMENDLLSTKAQLKCLQGNRLLMSAVFWSVLLPLDMVKCGLEAAKKHTDKTRGVSNHNMGPPHPHVWRSLLLHWIRAAQALDKKDLEKDIQILVTYSQQYSRVPEHHHLYIRQCRAKELRNDKGMVNWAISTLMGAEGPVVDKALMSVLAALGGDCRPGTAPACPIERKLQSWADNLTERLGGKKGGGKGGGKKEE